MIAPPVPANERQRLATLRSLNLLDTPPEERFDRITRLARSLFDVPIALVSLIDADRQWFKSNQGLSACETGRDVSFCGHTILQDGLMVVRNALDDARFHDNPLVTRDPNIRFYAGYPLSAPDGSKLGSLCIIDHEPREMSPEQLRSLQTLGQVIESELVALNLSINDKLTGLANHRGFLEIGGHTFALARRLGHTLQLLWLRAEPQWGRKAGDAMFDRMLVEVSQSLLTSFADCDLIARVDEYDFAVLLSRKEPTTHEPALDRLEGLIHQFNDQRPAGLKIAATAALVTYSRAVHQSLEDLIADAERQHTRGQASA
jgi:GGDEF domain-containing protein